MCHLQLPSHSSGAGLFSPWTGPERTDRPRGSFLCGRWARAEARAQGAASTTLLGCLLSPLLAQQLPLEQPQKRLFLPRSGPKPSAFCQDRRQQQLQQKRAEELLQGSRSLLPRRVVAIGSKRWRTRREGERASTKEGSAAAPAGPPPPSPSPSAPQQPNQLWSPAPAAVAAPSSSEDGKMLPSVPAAREPTWPSRRWWETKGAGPTPHSPAARETTWPTCCAPPARSAAAAAAACRLPAPGDARLIPPSGRGGGSTPSRWPRPRSRGRSDLAKIEALGWGASRKKTLLRGAGRRRARRCRAGKGPPFARHASTAD